MLKGNDKKKIEEKENSKRGRKSVNINRFRHDND